MAGETAYVHPPPNSLPLDGRVAIVTGGSRGIGRAITLHLRALGARVVINYASKSTDADLNSAAHGSVVIPVRADISVPDQVKALFDRAEEEFGSQSHILVNSAGILVPKYLKLGNTMAEDWDRTFAVNSKGAFLCCREVANRLRH